MNGLMRRVLLAAITAMAMTGALAAPASAGILTASASDCGDETLTQPFAQLRRSGELQARRRRLVRGRHRRLDAGRRREGRLTATSRGRSAARATPSRSCCRPAAAAISPVSLRRARGADAALLRQEEPRAAARHLDAGRLGLRQDLARPHGPGAGRRRARQRPVEAHAADADRRQPAAAAARRPHAGGVPVHPACWGTGRSTTSTSIPPRYQVGASSGPAASGCGSAPPASPPRWRSA